MDRNENFLHKTISSLRNAQSQAIELAVRAKKSGKPKDKVKWEIRRAYLEKQLEYFERISEQRYFPKTVFISYSKASGAGLFEYIKRELEKEDFEVITGFRRQPNTEGNVLKKVLKNLNMASIYLGILTKDLQIIEGESVKWGPSVWTMEEKGMALALEKPFVLIIDREIHSDFWKKTTPEKDHIIFEGKDDFYSSKVIEAIDEIKLRYQELALKYLQEIDDEI
ncbi:MAG: hypothetical protein AAF927_27075 [Bacteroidota bacterium]